jgi:hypothetical protein
MKRQPLAGSKDKRDRKRVEPEDIVGKTVSAVALTAVEGAYGNEPCYKIRFTDGTECEFVVAKDDDDD